MDDFISRHTVQLVTLTLATINFLIGLLIIARRPALRTQLIGIELWLLHVAVYYLVVLFVPDTSINLMAWSAVIRLHGIMMVSTVMFGIAYCGGKYA